MSDAGGQRLGGVIDAGDLGAVYSRGDQERRQAAIHPYPAATVSQIALLLRRLDRTQLFDTP